jgi:acetyl-CoA carboxylase biotin carboxylase subunit
MIQKLVIANRGEIASRVIRTAKRLGIRTVAVHSEADARALHVGEADERVSVGPAALHDTALKIEQILGAAKRSGADAVHPGYGFRLESGAFARACRAAGLTYVGPATETIVAMSSKLSGRSLAASAGVRLVPGSGALDDAAAAVAEAATVGYPVMLKAAAGGGGLGLHVAHDATELSKHFEPLGDLAARLFGDRTLYLEKLLAPAHLVEVQLAGDALGHLVHLGERDCSLQVRHQKLVEEAPAPGVSEPLRERLVAAALALGRALHLSSLASVEFLVAAGEPHFLEMNTRLQVEHPVTEIVTGLDLVQWQILVAAGEPLPIRQEDVRLRGHAVECRIYAEDPDNNFFPSPGVITRLETPAGPGIREDSGVYEGWAVPLEYDPMLSKLVGYGDTREHAIARLRRAIDEYFVGGIQTNVPLFRRILRDPDFITGNIDTGYLDRLLAAGATKAKDSPAALEDAAAIAAAIFTVSGATAATPAASAYPPNGSNGATRRGTYGWKRAAREEALR